ncbi:MAG: zinc ABC transporter substrate-binding protein [Actinomycetales bacterium]|nr:zinc ABC transporter substrate-binding protein [Actinomycetales bacterium]
MSHPSRRLALPALALMAVGLLAACGGSATPSDGSTSPSNGPTIVAAFYPLAYAAEQVAGPDATIINLTPPGAEAHDLELTAQQVAQIADADLVLYIPGFQPAVDEAVQQQAGDRALNVTEAITLLPGDPHVWLNPLNMATIGDEISARLSSNSSIAATAEKGASDLRASMEALNAEWAAGTSACTIRDLVVSHEAFGYLAAAYGFTQVGIAGLSPEAEPSPARLAEVAKFVKDNGITTIYYETLVDPKVAQTVAAETGAAAAVLDPLEGLPEGYDGDYVTVMKDNLVEVRAGQGCT